MTGQHRAQWVSPGRVWSLLASCGVLMVASLYMIVFSWLGEVIAPLAGPPVSTAPS